ncbi:hypothetical protein MFFC18_15480 [Mariniblastus fucicola]|uniref:Uncharacterized protein n=1 Tax=Mariniblastus fucicola TaxID=980251 RepID=A0A5B9P862_9BACT|nr:hypothetical protein MFFC18_15480 [Mariniblastus fucicola]
MAETARLRLEKYSSSQQCGTRNETLLTDLACDVNFAAASNALHERTVESNVEVLPVMDGDAIIRSVEIKLDKQLDIYFELSFLAPKYFVSPAFFRVILDERNARTGAATYGCGRLDQNGKFCISDSRDLFLPAADSQWAVLLTCRFGRTTLDQWLPKPE